MKNGKVQLKNIDNEMLKQIFNEALVNSFNHTCQIFSEEKHYNRDKTDYSFNEIVDGVLNGSGLRHITILYRDVVNENYDIKHWEFGMCSSELYLNVCVRVDLAETIFEKYKLTATYY